MAEITGTPNDDVDLTKLQGTSAADTIHGLAGNDEIVAGGADDTLIGGPGGDFLDGGAGIDTASFAGASQAVVANLVYDYLNFGDAAGDSYFSIENLTGSDHNDGLTGDGQANRLRGGMGGDFLQAQGGNDRLEGGAHNDNLLGQDGADKLFGGSGNDRLAGGAGRDEMTGGTGFDWFLFYSTSHSGVTAATRDVIADFSKNQGDKLVFTVELSGFDFIGQAAFDDPGQIRFRHIDGNTRVELNADADAAAEMHIQLTGVIDLSAGDFVFA